MKPAVLLVSLLGEGKLRIMHLKEPDLDKDIEFDDTLLIT